MGEIEIVEIDPIKVIGLRRTGPYSDIPKLYGELYQHAISNNIQLTGPAIYLSHEMNEEEAMKAQEDGNADLEAAFPIVGDSALGSDDIKFYELPKKTMARIIHKGPYDQIGPSYHKLFAWLQENEKEMDGLFRECYVNDPNEVGMENAITEIQMPIK